MAKRTRGAGNPAVFELIAMKRMKEIFNGLEFNGKRPQHTKMDHDLRICTWNVRTLYTPGAVKGLENVLVDYNADIIALQEIRWKGSGVQRHPHADVYFSGHAVNHILGCGFMVGNQLRQRVIGWWPIDERLARIRIRGKFNNISLVCAHAPTEDAEDAVKENYYELLDKAFRACPQYDVKIVLGDFNAKLGRGECGLVGWHSLHDQSTDNGSRLIEFAASNNLVISSTIFPHKNIHKATWRHPDGRTENQIDHVMIDGRHSSCVLDVRTFRGANVDSDYYMVVAKVRARISNLRKSRPNRPQRYQVRSLSSPETAMEYQQRLSTGLNPMPNPSSASIADDWMQCCNLIKTTAEELVGYAPLERKKPWFDEECVDLNKVKNEARQRMLQRTTRSTVEEYNNRRREERYIFRKKKRALLYSELLDVEASRSLGRSRDFYRKSKTLANGFKPGTNTLRSKNGELLTDTAEILRE